MVIREPGPRFPNLSARCFRARERSTATRLIVVIRRKATFLHPSNAHHPHCFLYLSHFFEHRLCADRHSLNQAYTFVIRRSVRTPRPVGVVISRGPHHLISVIILVGLLAPVPLPRRPVFTFVLLDRVTFLLTDGVARDPLVELVVPVPIGVVSGAAAPRPRPVVRIGGPPFLFV